MEFQRLLRARRVRYFLPVVVCVVLAAAVVLMAAKDSSAARIVADKSVVNVGPILQGQPVRHTFTIANVGSRPVIIDRIDPDCYCTVSDFSPEPLAPGDERRMTVHVRTSSLDSGPMFSRVRIGASDGSVPTITVAIQGSVQAEFIPSTTAVDFGTGPSSVRRIQTIGVRIAKPGSRILGVRSTDPHVTPALLERAQGDEVIIALTELPAAGWHSGLILIETSSQALPLIRIPVRGFLIAP